jgi:uncharacterized cupredoxin-like copper-binding protein
MGRNALVLVALLIGLAGCGGDDDASETSATETPAAAETVRITETDVALDPGSVSLEEPGTYTFDVVNEGQVAHALEIEGEGIEEETETLEPGERATLTVALEAGEYELYCPVGDHADRGMTGKLDVAGTSDRSGDDY